MNVEGMQLTSQHSEVWSLSYSWTNSVRCAKFCAKPQVFSLKDLNSSIKLYTPQASTHTMNVRPTTDLARHAILVIRGARHASTAPELPKLELGRQIFVYNHLQRNHVVYSLTKTLKVLSLTFLSSLYLSLGGLNAD